jgi:transcriptional regulator of NAD metabolism
MKITLEEKDFNYIYNILMSLPIRELEKVQEILKALESKKIPKISL